MQKARKRLLITGCALIAIAVMLILYAVLIGTGVINSRQRSLVIRAGTAEKAYDGVELVCEEWTLVHGELKSGGTGGDLAVVGGCIDAVGGRGMTGAENQRSKQKQQYKCVL